MALPELQRIPLPGHGPEDVVVDRQGCLYTGLTDGRVLSVNPHTRAITQITQTPGRPLGLAVGSEGELWICDSPTGLLHLSRDHKTLSTLCTKIADNQLIFCSNIVVARNGTVYFSVSSQRYPVQLFHRDILENQPSGAVYALKPNGSIQLLMQGLAFANGLVLDPDEQWLLVAETAAQRIVRYWLDGAQRGRQEVWKTLGAMPDNMAIDSNGLIWVALVSRRPASLYWLWRLPLTGRRWLGRLPPQMLPAPDSMAWVQAYTTDARLVHDYCWNNVGFSQVTGMCESGGRLYMGSLVESSLAWCSIC